jgi:hypothetical protein
MGAWGADITPEAAASCLAKVTFHFFAVHLETVPIQFLQFLVLLPFSNHKVLASQKLDPLYFNKTFLKLEFYGYNIQHA